MLKPIQEAPSSHPHSKNGHRPFRVISLFLLAAAVLMLTGCSSLYKNAFHNGTTIFQNSSTIPLSYSWWGNDSRHQYTLAGLDLFAQKYPELSVTPTYGIWEGYERRYRVFMKSNNSTDVMQINYSWLQTYSEDGTGYYDLSLLSEDIDLTLFTEDDLAIGTKDGRLNALPIAYNTSVFFYNADVYEQYGLALPKTWDDLFTAAKAMRADGIYPIGMVKKHMFLMMAARYEQTTGKKLFDEEDHLTATADDLADLMEFYKKLLDEKVMPPVDSFNTSDLENGIVAGVSCWISDLNRYCKASAEAGARIAQGDFPEIEPGSTTGWYIKPATMLAISKDTSYPHEAGKLLNFLLSDPDMALLQGTEKGVPVNARALETLRENEKLSGLENEATDKLNEIKANMDVILPILEDSDVIDAFKSESDKYIYGESGLHSCATLLQRKLAGQ